MNKEQKGDFGSFGFDADIFFEDVFMRYYCTNFPEAPSPLTEALRVRKQSIHFIDRRFTDPRRRAINVSRPGYGRR